MAKKTKVEKIWAYKLKHPEATAKEVSKATNASYSYVWKLFKKTGTPEEVLERGYLMNNKEHDKKAEIKAEMEKFYQAGLLTRPSVSDGEPVDKQVELPLNDVVSRETILTNAKILVTTDRAAEHGDALDNFQTTAAYWNAYLGVDWIEPHDVAVMMAMLKMARMRQNDKNMENYEDACGYMALGGEISQQCD